MKKVILIVLAIIIVLGVGGYFAYTKLLHKTGNSILSKVTLNPNCKYNDPDLCKFVNGWKDIKNYTFTSNTTGTDGKTSQMILKLAGTDKTQIISSEAGKENYDVITIADTTYTKDYTDNKWWKVTTKPVDSTVKNTEESKLDFGSTTTEDKTTYKKIGTEACGKLTCFKYQVIDPANTDSTEYIYFDNKDYQLRKTRSEMKDGSVSESTIDYSKVSISAPSPVKEGSPTQGTLPAGFTIPESSTPAVTAPDTSTDTPVDTTPTTDETVPTDVPTE